MPTPARNEAAKTFLHRFMGSSEAQRSFPKASQRAAVAHSELRARKKKRRAAH
jgi:hypothetical protein